MELRGDVFKRVDASGMTEKNGSHNLKVGDPGDPTTLRFTFDEFEAESAEELEEELHWQAEQALLDSNVEDIGEDIGYELVLEKSDTYAEVAYVVVKPHL